VYQWLHIEDHAVRGFAIGIASHGIGTARAFQVSEQAGAFAALGMGLNALLTALSLPWILPWLERLLA
jgi:putative effector of murein hydrolase